MPTSSTPIPDAAVEAVAKTRWERSRLGDSAIPRWSEVDEVRQRSPLARAGDDLQAAYPHLLAALPTPVFPDDSPGDVIAAESDGTIILDDGVTTWNPARATAFLVAQAQRKTRERLLGDEAMEAAEGAQNHFSALGLRPIFEAALASIDAGEGNR